MTPTMRARIYRPTGRNLARLARVLAGGGLVAVPAETVYGLAADALDARACRAIFKAKGRPANDPLIVHVASVQQAGEVAVLSDAARAVAKKFWPGPLTLVLPRRPCVPRVVTSGLDSVAVRMPAHPLFLELIRLSGCPLAAPSANPFGYISPTTAEHVRDGLGSRIGHILDGGAAAIGVESTILDLRDPQQPAILRPGAISAEALAKILGVPVAPYVPTASGKKSARVADASTSNSASPALAPGLLEQHYSPRTPLNLVDAFDAGTRELARDHADEAFLFLKKPTGKTRPNEFWLSTRGHLAEVAHGLFARLRQLDDGNWRKIHVARAPGRTALAVAVNDRLTRAAARRP